MRGSPSVFPALGWTRDHRPGKPALSDAELMAGIYARVTARLLAMSAAIWHNWTTAAPVKRSLIAHDH